ncbi:MAG TPA: hypothetical protein VMT70_12115 [Vicinamibacteria bacterium]|nr:hypothetical protein [Vicinamibacteria bacterium]
MKVSRRTAPRACVLGATALALAAGSGRAEPVRVWAANPHYFARDGKPLVLVTSDHHYGAVIDADFDFPAFLESLSGAGLNLTRIYPGGMFEVPDKYVAGNPLGPRPGRQILPWARSGVAGAHATLAEAGEPSWKLDLDRWNPDYFARLRAFVELAGRKGIVVEVALFNGMYADSWPVMAFYHGNNVQGVGRYEAEECGLFTTRNARNEDVVRYQRAYVAKIAAELDPYDNVIYDLCDEPLLQGRPDGSVVFLPEAEVVPWLHAMRDAFLEAEAPLPKKHVLGQTVQSLSPDLSGEAWCDWLPTEYVRAARAALEKDYGARKPLVNVESDYFGHGLVKPYTVEDVRVEGWWFLVGGGAGVINLNGELHRGQEKGGADTRERIMPQRKALKHFVEGFDLAGMARFEKLTGIPAGAVASALAEPGRQYAVYLFHGRDDGQWGAHFVATPGTWRDTFTVEAVPSGRYRQEWVDPASGRVEGTEAVEWKGGDLTVTTPSYSIDVALRMVAAGP